MESHLKGPSSRLLSLYRLFSQPLMVSRWLEQYGDPIRVPSIGFDFVITATPECVKQILSADPDRYRPFTPPGAVLLGEGSVLQMRGAEHRKRRTLLMPPFHGKRMRHYATVMAQTAHDALRRASDAPEVLFRDVAQSVTLDVILRTVFGVQEPERIQTFRQAVSTLVESITPALMFMPFLHRELGGIGPFARYRRAAAQLDALLQDQIERTRRAGAGDDVLSMLLDARHDDGSTMEDEEIRKELTTLLFAGHETTAVALCWAVDTMGRHPAVLDSLHDELSGLGPEPEPEIFGKQSYLAAAIKESLRLHPISTGIMRVLTTSMELGGHTLPSGMGVGVDVPSLHRRDDLYPEPERFEPQRFIDHNYRPFEYMPFGGGHRRCIGAAFASLEMQIVLGTLLTRFDFELVNTQAPRVARRNVTLAPDDGVPVRIRARNASVSMHAA